MHIIVRVIAVSVAALWASGCNTVRYLEAQSRVDPQTIALYDAGGAGQTCPNVYTAGQWVGTGDDKTWVPDSARTRTRVPGDFRDGAIPLRCLTDGDNKSIYDAAAAPATGTNSSKMARDRLAAILIKHSDDVCTVEMGRMVSREAMANTGLSFATSALATAGAIVTGDMAQQILSGGSALTNSTRENLNSHVYRNVLSTAVAKAITNERDRQRKLIRGKFRKPVADYTVDEVVMDVNQYHQSCSFYRGLGLVMDAVSRTSLNESDNYIRINGELLDLDARIKEKQREYAAISNKATEQAKALDGEIAKLISMREGLYEQRAALATPTGATPEPEDEADPAADPAVGQGQ